MIGERDRGVGGGSGACGISEDGTGAGCGDVKEAWITGGAGNIKKNVLAKNNMEKQESSPFSARIAHPRQQ